MKLFFLVIFKILGVNYPSIVIHMSKFISRVKIRL